MFKKFVKTTLILTVGFVVGRFYEETNKTYGSKPKWEGQ